MPLVEQELFTLPEHPSSPTVLSVVRVARSVVLCVVFCRSFFFLSFCPLAIVLSGLRFTDYEYPFCIFKLFLHSCNSIGGVMVSMMASIVVYHGFESS